MSWTADSAWRIGLPNAVAATADLMAVARGPKVEVGRMRDGDVVSTASYVLPARVTDLGFRAGVVVATTVTGRAWRCQEGGAVADDPLPSGRNQRTVAAGQSWFIDRRRRLCSEAQPEGLILGSAILQVVTLPEGTSLSADGWTLLVTAMNGLWLVRPSTGESKHLHPRPARALVGDDYPWAVYDDQVRLVVSPELDDLVVSFVMPAAAQSTAAGVLIGTRDQTWILAGERAEVLVHTGAEDISELPGGFVSAGPGAVTAWSNDADAETTTTHSGGGVVRLVGNAVDNTLLLTAAPLVMELEWPSLTTRRKWEVAFGPLAAGKVVDRIFVCGGESGLYMADAAGIWPVAGIELAAALDLSVTGRALFVATGAGVARLSIVGGKPQLTHQVELPGVSCVSAHGDLVVAQVEEVLEFFATEDLSPRGAVATRIDARSVRLIERKISVCGYDAVEVIEL